MAVVEGRGSTMGSVPASGLVRATGVVGDGSLVGAASAPEGPRCSWLDRPGAAVG